LGIKIKGLKYLNIKLGHKIKKYSLDMNIKGLEWLKIEFGHGNKGWKTKNTA
jgi:hypothetical protein